MREILFRGQTRRYGEKVWMDGSPVDSNWVEGYGVCMGEGDFSVIYAGDRVEKFTVYTDTVGQFTGLTDKNGKKIFEGDVVMSYDLRGRKNGCGIVNWNELFASWHIGEISMYGGNVGVYEVISNIHDNPELLEAHR